MKKTDLQAFLADNPEVLEKMRASAREIVARNFRPGSVIEVDLSSGDPDEWSVRTRLLRAVEVVDEDGSTIASAGDSDALAAPVASTLH